MSDQNNPAFAGLDFDEDGNVNLTHLFKTSTSDLPLPGEDFLYDLQAISHPVEFAAVAVTAYANDNPLSVPEAIALAPDAVAQSKADGLVEVPAGVLVSLIGHAVQGLTLKAILSAQGKLDEGQSSEDPSETSGDDDEDDISLKEFLGLDDPDEIGQFVDFIEGLGLPQALVDDLTGALKY